MKKLIATMLSAFVACSAFAMEASAPAKHEGVEVASMAKKGKKKHHHKMHKVAKAQASVAN